MKQLAIGPGFTLPESALDDVIAILGRRGRGKTTTAVVIVEELHALGARFCVVDPTGVWWGLKSSRSGTKPGISCVVMGGEHQDVPLAVESGEVIADFVADPSSPSCVLDLKPFSHPELVRFMTAFLARLYQKNADPLHLVLDEADQFAPQRPEPGETTMLGHAQRVTKMGRAKGLHPLFITQRPATLSKNVLTQAGMLVAHAITGPQDRNAVDEWIKANATEEGRAEFLATLPTLPRGTAYFWQPDIPLFRRVEVRDRHTFDSSSTPERGEARVQPKALAEVDLEALKGRIAATIEKRKAEDPRELRKTIGELRAALKKAEAASPKPAAPVVEKREVPILKDGQIKRLEAVVERVRDSAAALLKVQGHHIERLTERLQVVVSEVDHLREQIKPATAPAYRAISGPVARTIPASDPLAGVQERGRGQAIVPASPPPARPSSVEGLTPARERILDSLAWLQSVGIQSAQRTQLAFLADQSPTSSAYANNLGALRTAGLIEYGGGGQVLLTTAGAELARAPEIEPTPEGVQRAVLQRLQPARQRILVELIRVYPRGLDRGALADLAAQSKTSSAYANNLGAMRSLGLIDYRGGEVVALPVLFLEGAA